MMKIEPIAITFPLLVYGWRKPGYVELLRLTRFYRGSTERYWCQRVNVFAEDFDAAYGAWTQREFKIDLNSIQCLTNQPDMRLNDAGEIVLRPQPRKRRSR